MFWYIMNRTFCSGRLQWGMIGIPRRSIHLHSSSRIAATPTFSENVQNAIKSQGVYIMSLPSHPPTTEIASVLYGATAFLARHEDITNRTTVPLSPSIIVVSPCTTAKPLPQFRLRGLTLFAVRRGELRPWWTAGR